MRFETFPSDWRMAQAEPSLESAQPQRVKHLKPCGNLGNPKTGITSQVRSKTPGSSRSQLGTRHLLDLYHLQVELGLVQRGKAQCYVSCWKHKFG